MAQQKRNWVAIITMFFIFAMISFVTNMAAPFGNIWGMSYEWAGMMGNMMNFAAYAVMGIPAGNMLIKYGYKKTALIALIVGAIGLGIQLTSGIVNNIYVYLLGALICGFCVCMLNTVVNPMLNLLGGGGNTGNQLVQAGGSLNSLSGTATPLLVGVLVGTLTKDSFPDVAPLIVTGIIIFLAAFVIILFIKIEEPQGDLKNVSYEHSVLKFRHATLGFIAIFFYVGIEIATPGIMNQWISREGGFEGAAAVAGSLAAIYWLLMLVGRFTSTFISGFISTRTQMIAVTTLGIALVIAAIFTSSVTTTINIDLGFITIDNATVPLSCVFIFLCGLCTSIMWGGIFNLSTEGLGKYTAKASGLFMVMVVGGGVMPLVQERVLVPTVGYLGSYWLIVAMLAYILYYSVIGCKNVNKDIKVD
ncbi:MAG: MFS transporter [Bacteroidaceae bacterium]|nr:MFS transporter [Bacteroidaceae bacterium]